MNSNLSRHIPLALLVSMSLFWGFFYQSSTVFNDYGRYQPEWLLLLDGLIFLPVVCFICIENKKEALTKALAYSVLVVFLGSLVIPEESKQLWPYLESGRFVILAAFVLLELMAIFTLIFAIKSSLNNDSDPDPMISASVKKHVGNNGLAELLCLESRVWTYALFANKVKGANFEGIQHFSCHNKDGTHSNLMGFLLIILFELPVVHLLLHFLWSPTAANVVSGLTIIGLVFFVAEYRAIAIRPTSVTKDSVIIRYGVWNPNSVPFDAIDTVELNTSFIKRSKGVKRYNLSGVPNVKLQLNDGSEVYLGLDQPQLFVETMNKQLRKD